MGLKVGQSKNRHLAEITNTLSEMRNEGVHSDFTIKVGSEKYRVHKNILSPRSEYFEAMFRHDMRESQHGEVEMKDMDPECLKSCIDFIYTGELDIPDGKNSELLHASQILQLDDVREAIIDELKNNLSVENFLFTKRIAKLHNLKDLLLKCNDFEKMNIIDISSRPDFQTEEKRNISEILISDKLVISEKQKLNIAINWVVERLKMKDGLLEILNLIDMSHASADYSKNLTDNDPLIGNDLKLYKTLNDAQRRVLESSLADLTIKKKCDEEANEFKNADEKKLMFFNLDADCLQIIDPETNETEMLNDTKFMKFTGPFFDFTAVSLNFFVYILCPNKSVYRLNLKDPKPKWEKMPDSIEDHGWGPPAVSALNSVFVIGGSAKSFLPQPSNAVERFDPATRRWSRLTDAPSPVCYHAAVSLDETIYCVGGVINKKVSNAFRAFNASSSQWTNLPPMKKSKESCCAVAVNRRIFAFGGVRNREYLNEVECFNVMTSQWSEISLMNETIKFPCGCLIGNSIFIGSRSSTNDEIVKYDVRNNERQRVTGFSSFIWNYFIVI